MVALHGVVVPERGADPNLFNQSQVAHIGVGQEGWAGHDGCSRSMMKLLPGVSVAAHSRWSSFARRLVPWACPLDADRRQCFGPNTDTLSTYGSRSSERLLAGHSDLDGISWPKRFRIRQSP